MPSQKDSYQKRLFGRLSIFILPAFLIGGIGYTPASPGDCLLHRLP